MRTKTCQHCGEPFSVIEAGDDVRDLEQGIVYLGASVEVCIDCHRKREPESLGRDFRVSPDSEKIGV